jgi:S-adenosylmethionine/arginine decarboxylase-like enzyme
MFYMRKEIKEDHANTNTNQHWGLLSCIDLYNCDPQTIRSDKRIKEFVVQLCDLIEMKRFGETQVIYFGEDERVSGYSMTQLIETSLISAHFANNSNTTYLDVFSCKPYDSQAVVDFAKKFFKAEKVLLQVVKRK